MSISRLQNFFQVSSQNGEPMFKGKVRVFYEGTQLLAPVYISEHGVAGGNPMNIDGLGFADIWVEDTHNYRVEILNENDAVVKTFHNVAPIITSISGDIAAERAARIEEDNNLKTEIYNLGILMRANGTNTLQFYRPTLGE